MNRGVFMLVILALIALMFTSIDAHWIQGYTTNLVSSNTITKSNFGKYTTIGVEFKGLLATQDTGMNLGQITFAYGASSYIDDVKNCYAVSNTNSTQVALPNVEYTQVSYNDSSASNYTVTFDVTQEVINITTGSVSTIYCDVKFSAFPTSSVEGYYDGCFSVDVYQVNSANVPAHGYSAYVPRHGYDYRNCLQFSASDALNTARDTIYQDVFDYSTSQVITFTAENIPSKQLCDTLISALNKLSTDALSFIKTNGNATASISTIIKACAPTAAAVSSVNGFNIQASAAEANYTATLAFKVTASADISDVVAQYATARDSQSVAGFTITADSASVSQSPSCNDGVKDGDETDVDCGGDVCATQKCGASKACLVNSDCASQNCQSGVCANSALTATLSLALLALLLALCMFMN